MKYKSKINKLVNTKYGFMLCNKHDKYVGRALIKYGEYSEDEVTLFDTLCQKGDTVIEVGSNLGAHTLPLSKIVGPNGVVIAFEPQRIIFQNLCTNIALNSLENVYCFQKAASSKKGKLFLPQIDYKNEGNFGGVTLQEEGVEEVEVVKLDKFIQVESLKLIKIDAESMELDVLKGSKKLIKKFKPYMFVENDRFDKHKDLVTYIDSLDYDMYWQMAPLYNKDNFFNDTENIYGKLLSANMLCIPKSLKVKLTNFGKVDIKNKHPFDVK